ncbi:MAG: glycosyltransferase [Bacteroidales bacterium]|nr:glycosyltransferase [Bacteroidales bacterium]
MKVLFFTNTAVSAKKLVNQTIVGESWITALESRISLMPGIEIGIACQNSGPEKMNTRIGETSYYIVPKNNGSFKKYFGKRTYYKIDNKQALYDYLEIIENFQPDIIHIFGSENNYGIIQAHTTVPVIFHIQGVLSVYLEKFLSGFPLAILKKHSGLIERLKGTSVLTYYNYFLKRVEVEKECLKMSRFVMGRTDWDRRVMKILAPNARYYHCDEMIRKEFYGLEWRSPETPGCTLLSVIRNNPYKGCESVARTAQLLTERKFDFTWRIIGGRENDKINRIVRKELGIRFSDLSIEFLGDCSAETIVKEMKEADIFVHPSHIENSPNSVCEAMLTGMPVIATYTGGTGSILTPNIEGILIQDGDPYMMAGSIIELFENREMQEHFSKNARKRAFQRHQPESIITQLSGIYTELIQTQNEKS